MRSFLIVTVAAALSGCAFVDNLDLAPATLDPALIYLQYETVTVETRRDLDKYDCLRGVLLCNERAGMWDCYCS